MVGIILAGGRGTRLHPATKLMNKHLIPILNKPMILYPIQTLKALGISNILIISGGGHVGDFAEFLGDGSALGISLTYRVQTTAGGIAHALNLAEVFVGEHDCMVILGDNIFDNTKFKDINISEKGAVVFTKQMGDPRRFGVVSFGDDGKIKKIIEKPQNPDSDTAVIGLYKYPPSVFKIIRTLQPSKRGELEITDVNNHYIKSGEMSTVNFDGFWTDAGTPESLFEATKWAYQDIHN